MNYTLEMEARNGCLFAVARGERTIDNISAIAEEILSECLRSDTVDVFLDLRQLTGRLDVSDSIQVIIREFPRIGLFQTLNRVAVLESEERDERSQFFERAAQARGYNIRMFEDQAKANDWITEKTLPV